jgi:hypothetical protein
MTSPPLDFPCDQAIGYTRHACASVAIDGRAEQTKVSLICESKTQDSQRMNPLRTISDRIFGSKSSFLYASSTLGIRFS